MAVVFAKEGLINKLLITEKMAILTIIDRLFVSFSIPIVSYFLFEIFSIFIGTCEYVVHLNVLIMFEHIFPLLFKTCNQLISSDKCENK